MQWRETHVVLDFLHDELEDEFHVFFVPFLRAKRLNKLYLFVEKFWDVLDVLGVLLCLGDSEGDFQQNYLLQFCDF